MLEKSAILDRQVKAQGIVLSGGGIGRAVQLAQAVGLDENHPALLKRLEDVDLKWGNHMERTSGRTECSCGRHGRSLEKEK